MISILYRQDFNIDPYDYLKTIETDGRKGIAQIRFTMGLYRLWDSLLERFPGLLIDDCASGGRLLDVETMMRAIPLWRCDMSGNPSPMGGQNEILGLSRYLPYHQGGTFDYTPYFLRSAMTTGIACEFGFLNGMIPPEYEANSLKCMSWDKERVSELSDFGRADPEFVAKSLGEAIALREYWSGDFTALTPPADTKAAIVAYTLRLPDEDRGIVVVLRREEAAAEFTVKLSDVDPDKEYELVFSDEALVKTESIVSGEQLAQGLPVCIAKAPGSLVIYYRERRS